MTTARRRLWVALVVGLGGLVVAPVAGCSGKNGGAAGTGGGSGGASASGGRGGSASSGGATGTGGAAATGGATGSQGGAGGTAGLGGKGTATGGATGGFSATGGSSATGGAPGAGGGIVAPTTGPGCAGLADVCGSSGNDSCCSSMLVPGGTFDRSNQAANPATVSDFVLDKYEVSVGRFRGFIDSGRGTQANPPAAGAGAHPLIAGSGWDPAWNSSLAADPATLTGLVSGGGLHTWSASGTNDALPMNYVTWFEAFAFCVWDGGRLPTEAEWNYAAAGGDEQRTYPWGEDAPDAAHASFNCEHSTCTAASITVVGSKPSGNGRWGHADLAGNVSEWVLDTVPTVLYKNPCVDCAELTPGAYRIQRGGTYYDEPARITTIYRSYDYPTTRKPLYGFRCARARE